MFVCTQKVRSISICHDVLNGSTGERKTFFAQETSLLIITLPSSFESRNFKLASVHAMDMPSLIYS